MTGPRRIVSLVPSHTESLHGLGLADRVVGRTRFCIHPRPWVDALPVVGGTKDAKAEKVLALRPDLVVADKDENPKALVEALEAAGVEVLWSEIGTVADAADFLDRLGDRCGVPEAGRREAQRVRDALVRVRSVRSSGTGVGAAEGAAEGAAAPLPVFCPVWHAPWMTFDATAYPHSVLEAAGFRNVFAQHAGPRYFEVTDAQVAASPAQWTLLPTEPYPFHRHLDRVDAKALGPAGRRLEVIDGEALTWFGVRTAQGLLDLAAVRARLG